MYGSTKAKVLSSFLYSHFSNYLMTTPSDNIYTKRVAIFPSPSTAENGVDLQQLVLFLEQKGVTIIVERPLLPHFPNSSNYRYWEDMESKARSEIDVALSIGGDGTFLQTANKIGRTAIPILGLNAGRLGFLADVTQEEIYTVLEEVLCGHYELERRTQLEVRTTDDTPIEKPYNLNDIAILKQDSSSMIVIEVIANSELINQYQADGLIVATPTGSTAYSMSAGGPIVVPSAENFILSPVASHSLNVRPLIVPDSWEIELQIYSRSGSYLLSLDGKSTVLDVKTRLIVKKADFSIVVLKPHNHTFFGTLRNKLLWGADRRI